MVVLHDGAGAAADTAVGLAAASAIGCAAEAVFCAKPLCADSNSKQRQKKVRAKRVLIFFMELVPWQKSIILSDISAK